MTGHGRSVVRIAVAGAGLIGKRHIEEIDASDSAVLASIVDPARKPIEVRRKKKVDTEFKGARRFVSSDGFEILVGKKAKDNDFLTFRIAKSQDL